MPTHLRRLSAAACVMLSLATGRAADPVVPKDSPFVPPRGAAPSAAAPVENYELGAVSTIGKKTIVNLYDRAAKKGRWIAVGESADGISVVSFDAKREQVVIRVGGGPEKTLSLRSATATSAPVGPVAVAPQTLPPAAVAPEAAPAVDPAGITSAPAVAVATASAPPPVPGSIAHQEQEARMLVSDLLEIGMAQRKAYEDAQRKAAEQAVARATSPTPKNVPPAPSTATPAPSPSAK